jgi:hypothetical protein
MYRASHNGQEPVLDADTLDELEPAVRSSKPGKYHVDQIEREPLPSGHTTRRWGVAIKHPDGRSRPCAQSAERDSASAAVAIMKVSHAAQQNRSSISHKASARPPLETSTSDLCQTRRTQNRVLAERGDHDGLMPFPPLEIVNSVVPWSAAPDGPVTPLRTVIWPPVLNACLPANLIVTTSLP